jgi:hypothetical protein
MAQTSIRDNCDPTVRLTNSADYRGWRTQLQARCVAYNIWEKVNPNSTMLFIPKPLLIRVPIATDYTPAANIKVPTRPTELSATSQKVFREDLEYYKILLEQYKSDRHEYKKEQSSLQHIVAFIQSTVSPHLLRTCCLPEKSIQQWIIDLQKTIGMSDQIEQEQAHTRYWAALKPMRTPQQWNTWLAEYDEAAAEAEAFQVAEVSHINVITRDFIDAVNKVAPIWSTTFQDNGRFATGMDRKEMIQRFREHMMINRPLRSGKHKVFVADDASFLAEGGAFTQGKDGDAHPAKSASLQNNRGRPRNQCTAGRRTTTLKRPSGQAPATTQGAQCPACRQRHTLRDCFYVHPDNAPEWWKPNETISELIKFKREKDATFQGLICGQSRTQSRTPVVKQSHAPTPEISEE